ncbi:hypothetical protein Tco_0050575, partial [Tanacetum coccineum]
TKEETFFDSIVWIDSDDKSDFMSANGESSFMNENIENVINEQEPPQDKISEDPFGIYNILNKQDNK